jgi:DNA invertase Pin-like site-specific DNA recombinase
MNIIEQHTLMQRVACYVRVSSQEQKLRGLSPEAQRYTLRRYAEDNNLKIINWYEDLGVSGRKLIRKRPALQQMIQDAEEGQFDRIIFIKLDRYFRSVAEYYECQKRLDAKNVKWTATEEKYDLTTASGRYWVTQKLAMAEYEADLTGERIDLVNEYKVKTGQPLTGSRNLGFAYCVAMGDDGLKKVVKDPATKDIVMDYIEHYLVHQNKRMAHHYIVDKYNITVGYSALTRLLKDTKIYGHYRGNDNYCAPYIDKATFDKLQEIQQNNIKPTAARRVYLFTSLIRCPVCGRNLGGTHTASQKKIGQNGQVYEYARSYNNYRCNNHYLDAACDFGKCPSEMSIEKYLINNFDNLVNEYIDTINIEDARKKDNAAHSKIKEVRAEMTRLNTMYQKNRISEEKYDREYEDLEKRLEELEAHLEPFVERDLTIYKELLSSDWKDIYNSLDAEYKRAFWRKYIKSIALNIDGTIKEPIFF